MADPYRAPGELPPPPPDPMRTVLMVTGIVTVCGAIGVIGYGLWQEAHKPPKDEAAALAPPKKDAPLSKVRVVPSSLVGLCRNGWCWEDPLPTGDDLVDVSAKLNDTWIAAAQALLHWDGTKFSSIAVEGKHVTALVRAGSAVWAATKEGSFLKVQGTTLADVDAQNANALASMWASGEKDIWAVGALGTILHYDGARWATVASPTTSALAAVRGRATDDVWAVGNDGMIIHWNGRAWTLAHTLDAGSLRKPDPEPGGFSGTPALMVKGYNASLLQVRGILPFGASDVWFAAGGGRAIHYDGSKWADVDMKVVSVDAMWGTPKDAWAVGDRTIAHFDGTSWTLQDRSPSSDLRLGAIHGSAPNDIWAVGALGCIRHYDGQEWSAVDQAMRIRINTLWAGDGVAWAGGDHGSLYRREGAAWRFVQSPLLSTEWITAIGGARASDLWAFAGFKEPLHFDGKEWRVVPGPKRAAFSVAAPASDDVWAFGARSLIHWDGKSWTDMSDDYAIEGLWAPARGVAWATARPRAPAKKPPPRRLRDKPPLPEYDYGKLVLIRWNGKSWTQAGKAPETGIGGIAPDDVWVGGSTVARRDKKGGWTSLYTALTPPNVFRGGPSAHVYPFAPNDMWMSGFDGVEHWDGTAMHIEAIPLTAPVLVMSALDMFAYGSYGGILHRGR